MQLDGFLHGGKGLLVPPDLRQLVGKVVQRASSVGNVAIRVGLDEVAVDGGGFLPGGKGLLPPPDPRQPVGQIVQRPGQIREVNVRVRTDKCAA